MRTKSKKCAREREPEGFVDKIYRVGKEAGISNVLEA